MPTPDSSHASSDIEARVRAIGTHLLKEANKRQPSFASRRAQEERMLNQLMADEAVRVQMLRFVDVLPVLDDDADLVAHLDEYVGDNQMTLPLPILDKMPGLIDWTLRHARSGVASHLLAMTVRAVTGSLAKRFIVGQDARTAIAGLKRLHRQGMAFTLDVLGEATVSEAEADGYRTRYLDLLETLSPRVARWPANDLLDRVGDRRLPRLNLSVKLSAMFSQIDALDEAGSVEGVKSRLRPIMASARQHGAFITLDMEDFNTKAITIRAFQELLDERDFVDWPDAGIALQAYLRHTERDVENMIEWATRRGTPVTVRLVRGAYWDYETVIAEQHGWPCPVWTTKADTDRCYESCLRKLIDAHPHVETAVATHNLRSIALGIALAEARGLDPTQYEIQMLYGMADNVKSVLVDMGQRVRVYGPFGELLPGMAYLVRRLLENTSSQSFLRMGFSEDADPNKVLAPPSPPPDATSSGGGGRLRLSAPTNQPQPSPMPQTEPPSESTTDLTPYTVEPVRRFTDPTEVESFANAIEHVRGQLGDDYPLLIDGKRRDTDTLIDSINPAHPNELVGRSGSAAAAEANDAVAAATRAFKSWGKRPARDRVDVLLRAADLLRERRDNFAAWMVFEAGKPWREADADVCEAIDFLEYYARHALRLNEGHSMDAPGELNHLRYQPRGVAAVISPWNFPLAIMAGMTAAAMVVGNTVVVKPAPQTPVITAKFIDLLHEAECPLGVVNFLPGGDDAGKALVVHKDVHIIAFTGSQQAGCAINAAAAQLQPGQHHVKRVITEMGGKNAVIIDSDADIDDAVRGCVRSAFGFSGQKCSAASRLIVVGDIYDNFVERLVEASRSVQVGPPEDRGTFMGPVIDQEAFDRINAAIDAGATQATLALRVDASSLGDGYYIGPTVFADAPRDCPLTQGEIFGPVTAVIRARDFDDAIDIANGTRFALTGGVYSRSPDRLKDASRRFNVGNLYLNRSITGAIVGRQPFGGHKLSGVGSKAGGPDYLLQFVEPRTVTENIIRRGFAPDTELAESLDDDD